MIQNVFSDNFLTEKRGRGDEQADKFIQLCFKELDKKTQLQQWLAQLKINSDLNKNEAYSNIEVISSAAKLPIWADKTKMKQGSDFFAKHAEAIMNMLGLLSLPYCYTAAKGAMVLYLSGRLKDDPGKRLHETAEFVWEVMAPSAFETGGKGFISILKVRLMHAAARYYTLKSPTWKLEEWDTPINQEDMAGTNLSFSLLVIRGLAKLGYHISMDDKLSFMHLWNVIGYFSGIDEDLITKDIKQAQVLEASIKKRQFKISTHGRELTQSLIEHIELVNGGKVPQKDILSLMRHLLGDEVADQLGIAPLKLVNAKMALLKLSNTFKNVLPNDNAIGNYFSAYRSFKKQVS
ncbi:oxygenase MpaB family protein [Pedobacter mucosus]|uniref:oxygenase MpaB family protein n=1 Tax=Pedobacter mucosus TaxID=2895286 RepID=UPI001EE4111D|nr:oxygenase MpaB family protein [Pedobacter mucosus]UKT65620.1 DUF2236 domain-containing protein [Pedobacter mucosus]